MHIFNHLILLYYFPCYMSSEQFIQNLLFAKLDNIPNICMNVKIYNLDVLSKTSSDMENVNLRNSSENK